MRVELGENEDQLPRELYQEMQEAIKQKGKDPQMMKMWIKSQQQLKHKRATEIVIGKEAVKRLQKLVDKKYTKEVVKKIPNSKQPDNSEETELEIDMTCKDVSKEGIDEIFKQLEQMQTKWISEREFEEYKEWDLKISKLKSIPDKDMAYCDQIKEDINYLLQGLINEDRQITFYGLAWLLLNQISARIFKRAPNKKVKEQAKIAIHRWGEYLIRRMFKKTNRDEYLPKLIERFFFMLKQETGSSNLGYVINNPPTLRSMMLQFYDYFKMGDVIFPGEINESNMDAVKQRGGSKKAIVTIDDAVREYINAQDEQARIEFDPVAFEQVQEQTNNFDMQQNMIVDGNGQPFNINDNLVKYRQEAQMLPVVDRRKKGFDAYSEFGVSTRRGVKVKAKEAWAIKTAVHMEQQGYIGAVGSRYNIQAIKMREAYKKGWLVGSMMDGFQKTIETYNVAYNKALAKAYKRYNYTQFKYTKKQWIAHPVGLVYVSGPSDGNDPYAQQAKYIAGGIYKQNQAENLSLGQLAQVLGQQTVTPQGQVFTGTASSDLLKLCSSWYSFTLNSKDIPGKSHDFEIEEKFQRVDTTTDNYILAGAITLDSAYYKNKSIVQKVQFATQRGYNLLAMKYGLAVINSCYETVYVVIVPKKESQSRTKPIYAIPQGQRVNIYYEEVDFDDEIFFLAIGDKRRENSDYTHRGEFNLGGALQCELLYCTLQECATRDIVPFDEQKKVYKPSMSKYMIKNAQARIGHVTAQDGVILTDGTGLVSMQNATISAQMNDPSRLINGSTGKILDKMSNVIQQGDPDNPRTFQYLGELIDEYYSMIDQFAAVGDANRITASKLLAALTLQPVLPRDYGVFKSEKAEKLFKGGLSKENINRLADMVYGTNVDVPPFVNGAATYGKPRGAGGLI